MAEKTDMPLPPELLEALLNNPYESNFVVDNEGIIQFISPFSKDFFGTTTEEAVGSHITKIHPETEILRVLRTGKAEIGKLLTVRGRKRIVARIPLKDDNENVIGAVGKIMFVPNENLRQLVRHIESLENRLDSYQRELAAFYKTNHSLDGIVGDSKPIQGAKRICTLAAASDLGVLIIGETGTGKELFAQAIHQMSPRSSYPFIAVNCASIPSELFESELFGYEPGAFTGAAKKGKPGKFELANKGTILLDEIGDMPLSMQAKFLRVIQDKEVDRVGGTRPMKLDFRVIASTNRDLQTLVLEGRFRQDLYYRLNIFTIKTPPLRSIREDIPKIAYSVLAKLHDKLHSVPQLISADVMRRLLDHNWSGNVRELINIIERGAAVAIGGSIEEKDLPLEIRRKLRPDEEPFHPPLPLKEDLAKTERECIERALRFTKGNCSYAARLLGIHRTGLYQKMKRHSINIKSSTC